MLGALALAGHAGAADRSEATCSDAACVTACIAVDALKAFDRLMPTPT